MSRHLRTREQYEKAKREVARLGERVKAGTATGEERERYAAGVDHLLIYDWAEEQVQWRAKQARSAWWETRISNAA